MRLAGTIGLLALCVIAVHAQAQASDTCVFPAPVDSIPSAIAVEVGVANEAHDVPLHETNEVLRQLAQTIVLPKTIAPRLFGDFATPMTLRVRDAGATADTALRLPPLAVIVANWLRVDLHTDGSLTNMTWLATSYDTAVDAALLTALRTLDSARAFAPFAQAIHLDGARVMTLDIRIRTTVAGTRNAYNSQNAATHRSWLLVNRALPRYPAKNRAQRLTSPRLELPPDAQHVTSWPHVFGEVIVDETGHLVPGSLFPYLAHPKVLAVVQRLLPQYTFTPAYIGNCPVKTITLVNLE